MRPVNKAPAPPAYGGDYGVMRQRLLERIGSWCSYCEAPITNDTAVEHKVAKAPGKGFPARATEWVNLLLACQACNSAKSSHPNKKGTPAATFADVMSRWIWPDTRPNPAGNGVLTDDTLNLLTYDYSARTQQSLVNAGWARVPTGQVAGGAWYTTAATCVWVIPNTAWITTQPNPVQLLARVTAMLLRMNLNYYNPWSLTYGDRRVVNRTYARGVALQCAADLATLWPTLGGNEAARLNDPQLRLLVRSIRATALSVGYWSVWWTVLRAALNAPTTPPWNGVSAATREILLKRILVEYWPGERDGNVSQLIFTGTDTNRVTTTLA